MAKRTTPIDKESKVYVNNVGADLSQDENTVNSLLEVIVDRLNTINQDLDEVFQTLKDLES